ncbi:uncharacterized protein LOC144353773 [Saccoglossus kowalevskii]
MFEMDSEYVDEDWGVWLVVGVCMVVLIVMCSCLALAKSCSCRDSSTTEHDELIGMPSQEEPLPPADYNRLPPAYGAVLVLDNSPKMIDAVYPDNQVTLGESGRTTYVNNT